MAGARKLLVLIIAVLLLAPLVAAGCGESQAQKAFNKAQNLEKEAMLTKATAEYERAYGLFEQEGLEAYAWRALRAAQSIMFVQMSYPDLEADVRKKLAEAYPDVPESEREGWIESGELEQMTWDGEVHYFSQAADNIPKRYFEIAYRDTDASERIAELVRNISASCSGGGAPWQPYSNPLTWLGTESIDVPRSELPENGLLKVWFPLPVEMGGVQNSVSVVSVTPDTWLRQPPSTEGPLSDAYFEIPLEELEGDLSISVQFQFTHYQTNFDVDPDNVGTYDRTSAMYMQYTRSYGNTHISEEIRATANKVADGEKNPYLAAKKLYDYVLAEIRYGFMPHMAAWPRGEPESVYVHRMRRGDCGAQAMYFAAMCRSLGIPARTTGGWQLFTGNFAGHFWAEVFLPNYGWIPVDPTAADIADWTDKLSEQEKRDFKEFYFGNQDPLRCNVQFDVDEPLVPPIDGELVVPIALQNPTGSCATMEMPASVVLAEHYSLSAELLEGSAPAVSPGRLH